MRTSEKVKKLALCGVLCALGVVVMLFGGVIPIAVYCCPALAAMLLVPIDCECGTKYGLTAYAVVAVLAVLLTADKETAAVFVFLGYYPILKPYLDGLKKKSKALGLILKFTVFNAIICVLFLLTKLFIETDEVYTPMTIISAVLLENLFMVCYDVFLNATTVIYRYRIKGKIFKRHK